MAARNRSRWTMTAVFIAAAAGSVALAGLVTVISITLTGDAVRWDRIMHDSAPYALAWRLAVYVVLGGLYIGYWRPRLRAMQRRQADGGAAAHARLRKLEQLLIVALVAIEAANLPDLIAWGRSL